VNRAFLVSVLLAMGGVASAGPDSRPVAAPPPAPDGVGMRSRAPVVDNRRIIGILDVRVEGIPEEVKDSFERGLEDQLGTKQYWIATRARMRQLLIRSTRWTEGCLVGACLAEVRARTGAELVVLAALTGAGTSFGYVVTLVRTDTGHIVSQESERCDVCTVSEAMTKATLSTIGLINILPDKLPDEAAEQTSVTDAAAGKIRRELAAHDQHTTRLGLALTGIGLAVAVTGAVLYSLDSKSDFGVPAAVGGSALAIGGVAVLTF
jgi:hypothetical protein